jgi:hypothetical protein
MSGGAQRSDPANKNSPTTSRPGRKIVLRLSGVSRATVKGVRCHHDVASVAGSSRELCKAVRMGEELPGFATLCPAGACLRAGSP